jgi:hypothetical protein
MTVRRGTAAAIALLFVAALAAAGCGIGPGEGRGDVALTVTRDYGAEVLLDRSVGDVTESDTVIRVLDRSAEIETRYGGGFVHSIGGLAAERRRGESFDWFFYVNGVESSVGAADYPLSGGERVWWDHREWSGAMRVPAVVGSWPQPFAGGYGGKRRPVAIECLGGGPACAEARDRLNATGARLLPADGPKTSISQTESSRRPGGGAIRLLVGPWKRVREDTAVAQIEDGPQTSGVFADFVPRGKTSKKDRSAVGYVRYADITNSGRRELWGLGPGGEAIRAFGPGAGLVAATRRFDAPPVWVVTGTTAAGVRAAASLLNGSDLRDHYAVATEGGEEFPLPLGS